MRVARRRDLLAWMVGRRRRYRVAGRSMWPTLHPGDVLLVSSRRAPQPGDVVVAHHSSSEHGIWVKRVQSLNGDGLHLIGDNMSESTDSRHLGPVALSDVIGVATCRLAR